MCVNKSLVQSLESCPSSDVTPPAVLPTLVCMYLLSWKFEGLANAYVDSQNLDAVFREPCSYYGSASVPKWPRSTLRASDFQTFPGGACPQTPLVQIRHLCNPPSKNPGYSPAQSVFPDCFCTLGTAMFRTPLPPTVVPYTSME